MFDPFYLWLFGLAAIIIVLIACGLIAFLAGGLHRNFPPPMRRAMTNHLDAELRLQEEFSRRRFEELERVWAEMDRRDAARRRARRWPRHRRRKEAKLDG